MAQPWPHGSRRLLAQAPHHEGLASERVLISARRIGRRHGGGAADLGRRTRRAVIGRRTRRGTGRRDLARRGRGVAEATAEEIPEATASCSAPAAAAASAAAVGRVAPASPASAVQIRVGRAAAAAAAAVAVSGPELHHAAVGRDACHRRIASGLLAADFAARPGEIVGAAGGRRQRPRPSPGCARRAHRPLRAASRGRQAADRC